MYKIWIVSGYTRDEGPIATNDKKEFISQLKRAMNKARAASFGGVSWLEIQLPMGNRQHLPSSANGETSPSAKIVGRWAKSPLPQETT